MGVMECARRGCNNIMCDHYNPETGYICYECLSELKEIQKTNPGMTVKDIVSFMDTPKGSFNNSRYIQPMIDLDKFFE